MLLNSILIKTMLTSAGSDQYSKSLSEMCLNNEHLSRKVAKIFVKSINNAQSDSLIIYLKALKPFLLLEDDIKPKRLTWIFGYPQIHNVKPYGKEVFKYGVEIIQKIGEDAYTYPCPIIQGSNEDGLLGQLIKLKFRLDTQCCSSLHELMDLVAKDDSIARFFYSMAPPTYQHARYSDWIKDYLLS